MKSALFNQPMTPKNLGMSDWTQPSMPSKNSTWLKKSEAPSCVLLKKFSDKSGKTREPK